MNGLSMWFGALPVIERAAPPVATFLGAVGSAYAWDRWAEKCVYPFGNFFFDCVVIRGVEFSSAEFRGLAIVLCAVGGFVYSFVHAAWRKAQSTGQSV